MRSSFHCCTIPIIIILGLFSSNLFGLETVEWESVEGAEYYRIQFRQNGIIIQDSQTETHSFPVILPPGEYEFRVSVMNVFGKAVSTTDWSPLKILTNPHPFIIDFSPRTLMARKKSELTFKVIGYRNDGNTSTEFHMEMNEENIVPLRVKKVIQDRDNSLQQTITLTPKTILPPGNWDIVMSNSDNRETRIKDAVIVKNSTELRIVSIIPSVLPAGNSYNHVQLKIIGMEENAEILFNGPSIISSTLIKSDKDGILDFNLNLENVKNGWYSVEVINPSGSRHTKKRGIKIEDPIYFNRIQQKLKPISDNPHSLAIGYSMNFPIGSTVAYFEPKFYGFSIGYTQEIINRFFRRVPVLRDMGFEIYAMLNTAQSKQLGTDTISIWQLMLLPGLCYTTPFKIPVNLFIKMGLGLGYSFYSSGDVNIDISIGDRNFNNINSLDFVLRFGSGIQLTIQRFFINFSMDFSNVFYLFEPSQFLQPHVQVGFKW